MNLNVNSRGYSKEEINIFLLQKIVPDSRPPTNDPIPWTETGAFVHDSKKQVFFARHLTLFSYTVVEIQTSEIEKSKSPLFLLENIKRNMTSI